MAQTKPRVQGDAQVSFEGGCDSNLHPRLLQPNQTAWAVNCTMRGGSIGPRPGFVKRTLDFATDVEDKFQNANAKFQGAAYYRRSSGQGELLLSIGGRIFSIEPDSSFSVRDVTPISGANSSKQDLVTFEQAERWMVIQDDQSAPIIYNRAESRRAATDGSEVPSSSVGAYGNGRLWVASGSQYAAGDLVGSSSGNAYINRIDAVLKFTENDYLNEGGSFATPTNAGPITALSVMSALDTTVGEGDLIVFTRNSAFATTVPTDRTVWKNLSYPVQRLVAPSGAVGPYTVTNVNGDLYFRSSDGIRSLILARRDFNDPGITPISAEVDRALDYDDPRLLQFTSGVTFGNRLLHTCIGRRKTRGVVHQGIISLDFNPVSGIRVKSPLAYDGLWTGLNVLHLVNGEFDGVERCFIIALSDSDEIELWEIDPSATQDYTGTAHQGIEWFFETRQLSFDSPFEKKRMDRFETWMREVKGQVDLTLYVRPDDSPNWNLWKTWQEDAKIKQCSGDTDCLGLYEYRPSYRPRRSVAYPPNTCEDIDPKKPVNEGYAFQFRLKGVGYAKVDLIRFFAEQKNENIYEACPPTTATQTTDTTCPLNDYPSI